MAAGPGLLVVGAATVGVIVGAKLNELPVIRDSVATVIESALDLVFVASNRKQRESVVNGLVAIALVHELRIGGAGGPEKDPDYGHHVREIKAFLGRALSKTKRLPKKLRESATEKIREIAERNGVTL